MYRFTMQIGNLFPIKFIQTEVFLNKQLRSYSSNIFHVNKQKICLTCEMIYVNKEQMWPSCQILYR